MSQPLTDIKPSADSRPSRLPRHIAVIMDGNGRWAERRRMPRFTGHKAGADMVKVIVERCAALGIEALTLFAFSSENWQRPKEEVGMLMSLFMTTLDQQVRKLHENQVCLRVVGDVEGLSDKLRKRIHAAESLTAGNGGLQLRIAANYGGHWDITQAARQLARKVAAGQLNPEDVSEQMITEHLAMADLPAPDLFIRTGGEKRISNFLLWQLAYTELYFCDTLWPDFSHAELDQALSWFASRQRRYGRTGQQVQEASG